MIKLYNQLSKSVKEFYPINGNTVTIYTCGPTVYSYAHIGNLTAYIYWDLLIRCLTLSGYKVKRVLNLTDVGHLASDADEGEDKLEKGARREGLSVWQIAEKYIAAFLKDYHDLNLIEPQKIARATDYIKQDQDLVKRLIDAGYTYETTDGIYFDTAKFKTYSDFASLDLEHLKAGARVDYSSEKLNPSDFAIWKFIKPGEDHAMQWDFLGRSGYPGWHLECATIIHEELGGSTIDIHTGGIDHIPVHHTNEIAEYECGYGTKLANFWLHCNFLNINGEKISKSQGNTYTLTDLAKRGFSPLDFKLWVLQGHYRSERNFNFDDLSAAKIRRLAWRNRIAALYQNPNPFLNPTKLDKSTNLPPAFNQKTALTLLSNNLNSSELLAYIDNSILTLEDWAYVDQLLGLDLLTSTPNISEQLQAKVEKREAARRAKDYKTADLLRDELATENLTVLDTPSGAIWQYLS